MRAGIRFGMLLAALSLAPGPVLADATSERWETALANAEALILARTSDVRTLRKKTDELVEQLNELARTNVANLKPQLKFDIAQKRLYYYTQLGKYNAGIVELEKGLTERKLPKNVSPAARQKVLDLLVPFRNELRATVVSLNHIARSLKDL